MLKLMNSFAGHCISVDADTDRSHRVIEAVPVVPEFNSINDDKHGLGWVDSVYLATLLNATASSVLPLYEATVNSIHSSTVDLQLLIDSGASENYISSHVASLIQGTRTKVHGREVETAGGNITPITEKVVFNLDLQGHRQTITAKPSSFSTVKTAKRPQLNYLMSHLQAEEMLKEDGVESCFLYLLDEHKKDGLVNIGKDSVIWTKELMKDFPGVFKDKLSGLPPIRKIGLEPRFKGPYVVTRVFPDFGTYQLETIAGEPLKSLVHVDRLKKFIGTKPSVPHYDPTSTRREVREANLNRPDVTISVITTASMDLLVPDYIDPTVNDALASEISQETHTSSSSTMLPAVAQVDPVVS
ncbi:hypothetical protein INT48_004673, partial [Thamnidium elegans]